MCIVPCSGTLPVISAPQVLQIVRAWYGGSAGSGAGAGGSGSGAGAGGVGAGGCAGGAGSGSGGAGSGAGSDAGDGVCGVFAEGVGLGAAGAGVLPPPVLPCGVLFCVLLLMAPCLETPALSDAIDDVGAEDDTAFGAMLWLWHGESASLWPGGGSEDEVSAISCTSQDVAISAMDIARTISSVARIETNIFFRFMPQPPCS